MASPFFSLIIPVYRTERFVKECFESVLEQTFREFETVVIDDGSPGEENQDSIEESFRKVFGSDKRFKFFKQDNRGVSAARNKGINNSKGIFLKFMDSDDCLLPDHLMNLYEQLNRLKDKWDNTIFYLKQIRSFIADEQGNKTFIKPHLSTKNITFHKELIYFGISGPKLIMSRNLVGDTRFCEDLKPHEEPDFYLRVFLENRKKGNNLSFTELNDNSYLYRIHQSSITKQLEKKFNITAVKVYKNLLDNYQYELSAKEKLLCRLGIIRFSKDERKSFYQKYSKKFFGLIAKIIGRWWK